MTLELLIIVALILANGLFAGAEIAVLSVRKTKVQERAERHDRRALALQSLHHEPERFLATVQIGITVVSTAAAAFGGASIARSLTPVMAGLGLGTRADDVAFAIVIALVSFLSLILGELVPKSLALRYSDGYSFLVGRPLLALSRLVAPLVRLLTWCSNLVLRFFGDRTSFVESRVSREEVRQLVNEAAKTGSVDQSSSEIVNRALELDEVTVAEMMVPREQIVALPRDATPEQIEHAVGGDSYSRIPVYERELDQMVGYVVSRDVLAALWAGKPVRLGEMMRPLLAVPLVARATTALRQMQARRSHIAIVVDEHGLVAGLVSIEDLVEEVVGDIKNEDEDDTELFQSEPTGTTLVPGWVPVRRINRALHLDLPINRDSTTVAGLCLSLALAMPRVGEKLQAPDGTTLEIVDRSSRRIRMIRLHHRGA